MSGMEEVCYDAVRVGDVVEYCGRLLRVERISMRSRDGDPFGDIVVVLTVNGGDLVFGREWMPIKRVVR